MSKAEWMSGKYGVMFHFLPQIGAVDRVKKLSPNEMADAFNVKAFVDNVQKMGASWVIFPFGQNSGYYWSENPEMESRMPGRCTNRDLVVEIADELTARGIRFMAYIPTEMEHQEKEMQDAFEWNLSDDKKEFMDNYIPFIRYYAEKLGNKLSGWWFDGCYYKKERPGLVWDNNRFDKEKWFTAAKAGNPDALIAMCTGPGRMQYVFEEEEYLAGEANELTYYPWDCESREKQWHVLQWLDVFWILGETQKMPEPRFSNKELFEYVQKCISKKGAVTLNVGIFEDGTLAEKTVEQVCGLRKVLKVHDFALWRNRYVDGVRKFDLHMDMIHECIPYEYCHSEDGMYSVKGCELYELNNWMTSFVTGLAPLYYMGTKNEVYLKWANQFEQYYHAKVFDTPMDSMHDLGFLYSPYSVAMYKLTGDRSHRRNALKAADELAKRFVPSGGYIDAWERMDETERPGRAIIDSMMNLPLLLWAWKETGHTFYRDIALTHAEVTRKLFVREDYSVAHSFIFDKRTGEILGEANNCGYGNESWWARGAAWAVYGFAILAKYLDSDEYRKLAAEIAKAYMSQLPEESCVPVWDFRLPEALPAKKCGNQPAFWDETKVENCEYNVDTSATAIVACGLICLYEQMDEEWMLEFAIRSIEELCNDTQRYLEWRPHIPGMLKRQNGQMVYTVFGDYFLIEALSRVLFNVKGCWENE